MIFEKLFDEVVQDCTYALEIDPNYGKALTRRARALENLEKYPEAFEDFTALCILNKFSGPSMAAADKVVKKIGERMGAEIFRVFIFCSLLFFVVLLIRDILFEKISSSCDVLTNFTVKIGTLFFKNIALHS